MNKLDRQNVLVVAAGIVLVVVVFIIAISICDVRSNPYEAQQNKDKIEGCKALDSSDARATCMVVLVGGES